MEKSMAKVYYTEIVNGVEVPKSYTTQNLDTASVGVKVKPGVGKPFWAFNTVPTGQLVGVDMTGAPVATSDWQQNRSLIDAIIVQPEDVLVFAP